MTTFLSETHRGPASPRERVIPARRVGSGPISALALQRSAGNRAVAALLSRRAEPSARSLSAVRPANPAPTTVASAAPPVTAPPPAVAPAIAPIVAQRCGSIPPDECPCHDDDRAGDAPPAVEAVQRDDTNSGTNTAAGTGSNTAAGNGTAAGTGTGTDAGTGDGGCSTRCGGVPASCPPPFCCPFPTGTATLIKSQIQGPFLAAIASQVRASVVPVWAMWFNGGTSVQDFTGRFGTDFSSDPTTAGVSAGLDKRLPGQIDAASLQALTAATPPGTSVSLLPALQPAFLPTSSAALEAPGPLQMDFDTIGTAPGNLAGGIGKTQTTCAVGATPSPQDDGRQLTDVRATLVRKPDGSITVTPTFVYRVLDTVDLCPGNCGSGLGLINEQLATVPMSRLEASAVSGDVPFTVDFPSPPQAPFDVPAPAPPTPKDITLSASALFDFGSDQLRPDAEAALDAQLGTDPDRADLTQPFVVEGHTDSKGSSEFNQGLSERRARRVADLLARKHPNLAGHLTDLGFGESRPVAPNELPDGRDNPAGRRLNRRVELHFSAPPGP